MSHVQETIDAFALSLQPGRRLDRQAALALLGCKIVAPSHACSFVDLPPGSTWGQLASEVLNTLSRAA